jgi:Ca2+-binding RTX toxin-like protein
MSGGSGNDSFRFATTLNAATNVDQITDFIVADDTIVLDNAVFTALTATGTLATENFAVGAAAADADDFIIYDDASGALFYDADGSGLGDAQVQFATLNPGLAIANDDFLVV